MRFLMSAVLCIAIICGVMTHFVVASPPTLEEWTTDTESAVHTFVVAIMKHTDAHHSATKADEDARRTMDILDYAKTQKDAKPRIDDSQWLDALKTLESQFFVSRPIEYASRDTWKIGSQVFWAMVSEMLIQSLLAYDTMMYDELKPNPDNVHLVSQESADELYAIIQDDAKSSFDDWINEPLSSLGVGARILNFTNCTFLLTANIKLAQEWGCTLSKASHSALNGFRASLQNHPDEKKWDIVSQPLIEKLIEVLEYVEEHDEWPDKVTPRK